MAREPGWNTRRGPWPTSDRRSRARDRAARNRPLQRTTGFFGDEEEKAPPKNTKPAGALAYWSSSEPRSSGRGQFDYRQASVPTRRYLAATRTADPYQNDAPELPEFDVQEETRKSLGDAHRYKLTPWQMEQAELDYGLNPSPGSPNLWGDKWETARVTPDAWDAMTPEQQNALRFNEALVEAVKQDRALNETEADDQYINKVDRLFGTQGGSEMYAPKTLELLETFGMGNLRGQDFDEFLSLDRAFSSQEVAALKPWDEPVSFATSQGFAADRTLENTLQLDRWQIDQAGALAQQALADPQGWSEGSNILMAAGLRPAAADIPFGYLDLENGESRVTDAEQVKEEYFQAWMNHLIATPDDLIAEDLWYDAANLGLTDADMDEFFGYVRERSYGLDEMGNRANPQNRTGAEIRALLGLEG